MIDGVVITPLRQICDERGKVMKMLSKNDPIFKEFGEIYFSCVYPGVIKGWSRHLKMVLNYAVLVGRIKLVLYDARNDSPSHGQCQEMYLGLENYSLITIPPLLWYGFKGLGNETAMVANCATIPHDPCEIDRVDLSDPAIPYKWSRQPE